MFSGSIFPHWRRKAAQRSNNFSSSYEVPFFMNAAYYANWRIYRKQPPSSLRLGFISHIFYAFAWVKEDGTVYVNSQPGLDIFFSAALYYFPLLSIICSYPADRLVVQLSDEWADSQMPVDGTNGCLRAFTQLKTQYSKLKVILSVGGGGKGSENFAAVAGSQSSLETFVRTAKGLVDEFGLDGIDIDWEHPSTPAEGSDYVRLLARLREVLPSPRYVLATCLPAGEWALRNIDLCKAQNYVDLINIMAYDFSGPWTSETGHQAQLYSPSRDPTGGISCQSAIAYVIAQGVNPKKILLGIPAYGRSFRGPVQKSITMKSPALPGVLAATVGLSHTTPRRRCNKRPNLRQRQNWAVYFIGTSEVMQEDLVA